MKSCLLAAGADKDKADHISHTALIWAAREGHVETVQLLLSSGADRNKVALVGGMHTALSYATRGGHQEIVQLLQPANP